MKNGLDQLNSADFFSFLVAFLLEPPVPIYVSIHQNFLYLHHLSHLKKGLLSECQRHGSLDNGFLEMVSHKIQMRDRLLLN